MCAYGISCPETDKGTGPNAFQEKGCLIGAATFNLLLLWSVFVELWASHGNPELTPPDYYR